jgi:hypothetical protein
MPPIPSRTRSRRSAELFAVAWIALPLLGTGCASSNPSSPSDIPDPVFTDPLVKLQETRDLIGFSETLFAQYVHQEPALVDPTVSVYMAFYAGANQRGLALAFVDTTNYVGARKARAIWIEGTGDWQYAAYRLANESERWYERSSQEDPSRTGTPLGNQVTIHGQTYLDPFPVTTAQYKEIWATYSAAYAAMAPLFHGRGLTVHARAFLYNVGETSAFWAECRTIRALVLSGDVADFKCANTTFPGYAEAAAWIECPADCKYVPPPPP